MKEQDEVYLWNRIKKEVGINGKGAKKPRQIINEPSFPIHYKRAWYLLYKWYRFGWYDYETTVDLGWVTPKGNEIQLQCISWKSNWRL